MVGAVSDEKRYQINRRDRIIDGEGRKEEPEKDRILHFGILHEEKIKKQGRCEKGKGEGLGKADIGPQDVDGRGGQEPGRSEAHQSRSPILLEKMEFRVALPASFFAGVQSGEITKGILGEQIDGDSRKGSQNRSPPAPEIVGAETGNQGNDGG